MALYSYLLNYTVFVVKWVFFEGFWRINAIFTRCHQDLGMQRAVAHIVS